MGVLLAHETQRKHSTIKKQCMREDVQYNVCITRKARQTTVTACMDRNVTDSNRCLNMAVCLMPVVSSQRDLCYRHVRSLGCV